MSIAGLVTKINRLLPEPQSPLAEQIIDSDQLAASYALEVAEPEGDYSIDALDSHLQFLQDAGGHFSATRALEIALDNIPMVGIDDAH